MAALLKDALKPNLVQTLEGTPGVRPRRPLRQHRPRLQLRHGHARSPCALGDYAITEAGFGADLGAEKFLDIKCRLAGLKPDCVVVVATVRALKYHGGVAKAELNEENLEALETGLPNLLQHVENITQRLQAAVRGGHQPLPHRHRGRAEARRGQVPRAGRQRCPVRGVGQGRRGRHGAGRRGRAPVRASPNALHVLLRATTCSIDEKIEAIAKKRLPCRRRGLRRRRPRSRSSSSDGAGLRRDAHVHGQDPVLLLRRPDQAGRAPAASRITVRDVKVSAGAGFVVALTGDIMTMPGLPQGPRRRAASTWTRPARSRGLF